MTLLDTPFAEDYAFSPTELARFATYRAAIRAGFFTDAEDDFRQPSRSCHGEAPEGHVGAARPLHARPNDVAPEGLGDATISRVE